MLLGKMKNGLPSAWTIWLGAAGVLIVAGTSMAGTPVVAGAAPTAVASFPANAHNSVTPLAVTAGAVYSNVTTFSGTGYANGGTTGSGGVFTTDMVADDLRVTSGGTVTQFTFTVANLGGSTQTLQPNVRFYTDNSGAPGTLLAGFSFNGLSVNSLTVDILSYAIPASNQFVIPSGTIWGGVFFTGSDAIALNDAGQGLFNPVDVGSSADLFYSAGSAGQPFVTNNPAGSIFNFGSGGPVANFGWEIVAPEPASIAMVGLGAMVLGIKRRR